MISIVEVQDEIVSELKSLAPLVALLPSADNIKESSWQGTNFTYPAVRVSVGPSSPNNVTTCTNVGFDVFIGVMSEEYSSLQCQAIVDTVSSGLHGRSFTRGIIRFIMIRVISTTSPQRIDDRTWFVEVKLRVSACQAV